MRAAPVGRRRRCARSTCSQASKWILASPLILSRSPTSATMTSAPRLARWRATTKPSPPLLPGPQKTTARARGGVVARDDVDDAAAGRLHEHDAGHADRVDGLAIERAHLRRGDEERHRQPSATTNAIAESSAWVIDRCSAAHARARRRRAPRCRVRRKRGRAVAVVDDLELVPAQPLGHAQRLQQRLLGGEARGEVLRRLRARAAVGALGVGEQARLEPLGVRVEGARHAARWASGRRRCRGSCRVRRAHALDRRAHLAHRALHADEHRARDDGVADVELARSRGWRRPAPTLP